MRRKVKKGAVSAAGGGLRGLLCPQGPSESSPVFKAAEGGELGAGWEWGWGPPKRPAPVSMLMGLLSRRRAQSGLLPTCKGQLHQEHEQAQSKREVTTAEPLRYQ